METQTVDKVFCYSGNEYPDRPVSFLYEGELLEVFEIIARWRTPQGKLFRITTSEGRIFDIFFCEACDGWKIKER